MRWSRVNGAMSSANRLTNGPCDLLVDAAASSIVAARDAFAHSFAVSPYPAPVGLASLGYISSHQPSRGAVSVWMARRGKTARKSPSGRKAPSMGNSAPIEVDLKKENATLKR